MSSHEWPLGWNVYFNNNTEWQSFLYGQNSMLDSLDDGRRPVPGVGMLTPYLLEPQQHNETDHQKFISVVRFNTEPMFDGIITVTCGNQDVQCCKNVAVVCTG